ncbi:hypothetical protein B9Z19DRAFT_233736 [Tuber borchii]|uniref:Uncharacterized protein n=1 Tax=Tuber borchii TaxID=42251 RepID=A0A2T7A5P1_TUBBO|nr:hypothetical protein B9Z19DRAFT_233736 [Tuber borchii]
MNKTNASPTHRSFPTFFALAQLCSRRCRCANDAQGRTVLTFSYPPSTSVTVEKEDINLEGYSFRSRQAEFLFLSDFTLLSTFSSFLGNLFVLGTFRLTYIYTIVPVCVHALAFRFLPCWQLFSFFPFLYTFFVFVWEICWLGVGGLDCVGGVSERLWLYNNNV